MFQTGFLIRHFLKFQEPGTVEEFSDGRCIDDMPAPEIPAHTGTKQSGKAPRTGLRNKFQAEHELHQFHIHLSLAVTASPALL